MTFSSRHIAISATVAAVAAGVLSTVAVADGPGARPASPPEPTVNYCRHLPVSGTPRWSLQGGRFDLPRGGAWTLGHGALNARTRTASGYLCQHVRPGGIGNAVDRTVAMKAVGHYDYRSYAAHPKGELSGDVLGLDFKVVNAAYDPHCRDGRVARVTLYGPHNGARSNSVRISFPATPSGLSCTDQDRTYDTGNVSVHIPALSDTTAIPGVDS